MLRPLTGHQEDFPLSSSKVVNDSSVHEYYVIKSGYDENRLTKQNHSTTLQNTDRQGKLLNRTPFNKDTFLHNLSNHLTEYNLAAYTGDGQKGWKQLTREDVEVHLHARQTKAEHFWLCVWVNHHLEKLHHC